MFKISIVEADRSRRLVLEGKLARPWIAELEEVFKSATDQLQGRELIIDLANVTFVSPEGENTLLQLMKDGAKFSCKDVLTKHMLKQLARKCGCTP